MLCLPCNDLKKSTKVARKTFLEVVDRYGSGSDDVFKGAYLSLNISASISNYRFCISVINQLSGLIFMIECI